MSLNLDGKIENPFLQEELAEFSTKWNTIPDSELISCIPEITQLKIVKTRQKQLTLCLRFPDAYPQSPCLVEMKSSTLDFQFLTGLTKVVDDMLATNSGKKQILLAAEFVHTFLESNQLCACAGEIRKVKRQLLSEQDDMKLKQTTSQITLTLKDTDYFMTVRFNVPNLYPDQQLNLELIEHNFPQALAVVFIAHANEAARKCLVPPSKPKPKDPPFEPQPSLYPVVEFLVKDCVRRYSTEKCPLCNKRALPDDPKDVRTNQQDLQYVDRVFCGHIFHFGCLDTYLKKPPFKDGKPCPSCKSLIFHDKWRTSATVREQRWAAKQAKKRELEEVVDFLS